jgi:hypothetical protein
MLHSWERLDPNPFRPAGSITDALVRRGVKDLRAAGKYVRSLPYGRNSRPADPLAVLSEGRGTCSTKHALLRRVAIEQNLELALVLGIYQMSERNTPGVGAVLHKHGLRSLPEAHCYVRSGGIRIDVTRAIESSREAISHFLYEEDIEPEQITSYKKAVHRQFLSTWMVEQDGLSGWSLEDLWSIREECIASLSA